MIRLNQEKLKYLRVIGSIVLGIFFLVHAFDASADDYFKKYKEGRESRKKRIKKIKMPKGVTVQQLQTQDGARDYYLYVPESYQQDKPAPLVFFFHGGASNGFKMSKHSPFHELADRDGVIMVYPDGSSNKSEDRLTWNAGDQSSATSVDDVGFVRNIYQELKQNYNIDGTRVYATGFSRGAMFAYHAACELSDIFAAVAPVAGPMTTAECRPAEPVAVYHVHGREDSYAPIEGTPAKLTGFGNNWPPVTDGLEFWRQYNGCEARQMETFRDKYTRCSEYVGCDSRGSVEYCFIKVHGHAWPQMKSRFWQKMRGVPINQTFPATDKIWKFLLSHKK